MLHINELTYRVDGKVILENATAGIPPGHKVGLVGRNGCGKTTLLRLISGELGSDDGSITMPKNARLGIVSQEAPGGPESLLETVLAADIERANLLSEAETCTDPGRIGDIQVRLVDIDAHSAPSRAATILAGLGFDHEAQQRSCSSFSGGWRMRVALGAALFAAPEILLLDEPTNYLDIEGAMWLESFIRNYPHTCLIVSHDRDMLNAVVTHILHLRQGKLNLYTGGYDQFEDTLREHLSQQAKMKKKQDDQRRHMEAFVDRFRAKANKAKQAQSRLKALAKMKPIAAQLEDRVAPFIFPNPKSELASPMIRMEDAATGYDPEQPILRDLNLRIDHDDRIALLGANGNGKSTFAKFLDRRLDVFQGTRLASKKMTIGFFAQHQIDDLNPRASAYEHIAELMPEATEAQKRSKLGQIGFGADKADTKADHLSGGEKARLLFALSAFHGPHLLVLDEPTNHLDVDSREALIHALNDYEGAVILISHDRHLIEATVDRLWIVRDGTISPYEGDLNSYRAEIIGTTGKGGKDKANGSAPSLSKAELRKLKAERRQKLVPLKKLMDDIEKKISKLASELETIDIKLGDTEFYDREPEQAQDLVIKRGKKAKDLEMAEEAWMEATEVYEGAKAEIADI